jgi:general nucleoside transport system permease protein
VKSPVGLEKRLDQRASLTWLVPLLSILSALAFGALLLLITGRNPISVYQRIFERGFLSRSAMRGTLIAATPLAFTGLCAAAAFRLGVINVGGEGQLYLGAVGASWAALRFGGSQPLALTFVLMIVVGGLAGALWSAIAGVLRARLSTNEIITTLMLNYLAGIFLEYLIFNSRSYWRDTRSFGFPSGKQIPARSFWPSFTVGGFEIPLGFTLASIVALLVWFLYRRTTFGYEVDVIADSPSAARYAGIKTRTKIVVVMALSGALAGIGGASDVGDFRHVLDAKGIQLAGYGYTGIVVAALARRHPVAVLFVAVLIGGLTNAGYALQGPDFPAGLVGTLQGLILFTAVAGEILTRYRVRWRRTGPPPTVRATS